MSVNCRDGGHIWITTGSGYVGQPCLCGATKLGENPTPTPDLKKQIEGLRKDIVTLTEPPQGIDRLWLEGRDFGITAGYNQALDDVLNIIGGDGERN